MCSADCPCTRLRETELQNLSLFEEVFNRTCHVFDWHFRINAVLVIEINAISSKALERGLNHLLDVLWPAIKSYCPINLKTELACDNNFVAERREGFSDKLFVCIWAANFGCIEKRDALFKRCTYSLNALVYVCGRSVVGADTHAP